VPDAAQGGPSELYANPQQLELLTKMGSGASFLIHAPGRSSRGVDVRVGRGSVRFRMCSLASPEDYAIAIRLASAVGTLAGALVEAEHGPDGNEIDPVAPTALAEIFDAAFVARNALAMAAIGASPAFIYTPRGWARVALGQERPDEATLHAVIDGLRRGDFLVSNPRLTALEHAAART
jgi:hypothetical protein